MLQTVLKDLLSYDLYIIYLYGLLIFCLCWQLIWRKTFNTPYIHSYWFGKLRSRWLGILFLFRGVDMIEREYQNANGKPFIIQTPGRRHVVISSWEHIRQMTNAPRYVLSLHAVAKDLLQPKYTMQGWEWSDQRGVEGVGFVRALQSMLTPRLPELLPALRDTADMELRAFTTSGLSSKNFYEGSLFSMCKKIVAKVNCLLFFGPMFASNSEFTSLATAWIEEVSLGAELIRCLPKGIGPVVSYFVTKGHPATKRMHLFLCPEVIKRLELAAMGSHDQLPSDCLQWLIETRPKSKDWSPERLVNEALGVWFGSVHTLSIAVTFAILDLYSQASHERILKEEADSLSAGFGYEELNKLPLLDNFLKESFRYSAFEATFIRRQALMPFTFSDGTHVHTGDWITVPYRAMIHDARNFSNPSEFNCLRFARQTGMQDQVSQKQKLVDVSEKWMVWGVGRLTCPGRYYASAVLKTILVLMLQNYNCRINSYDGVRHFQWRSSLVPKKSVTICIQARN